METKHIKDRKIVLNEAQYFIGVEHPMGRDTEVFINKVKRNDVIGVIIDSRMAV